MSAYWHFVENFYRGVPLLMPINRNRGFQLFELHDRQIVVAAFDSTNGNDCFSYSGAITQGTVARCYLALRDIPRSYSLKMAVWHHSLYGPPLREDYMDVQQIHEMAGLGFQLGLHGHQHVAAATTHYVYLSETQSMAVVSAGSLCASNRELPRGVNRQYNIVVIDDSLRRARVHVREMVEGEQFSRKNSGAFSQGFLELALQANTDAMGRAIDARQQNTKSAILQAEEAFHAGDPRKALDLLNGVDLSTASHARRIATQAALKVEDWSLLATMLAQPHTAEETVFLISVLIKTNALDRAETILSRDTNLDMAMRREFEEQIRTKRMMRGQ